MDIKTKYDIGQKIYMLDYPTNAGRTTITCPCCSGRKVFKGDNGEKYRCPSCQGSGVIDQWKALDPTVKMLTVGQIMHVVTKRFKSKEGITHQEELMCYETGVGSGQSYRVGNNSVVGSHGNFWATLEEAEAELEKIKKSKE